MRPGAAPERRTRGQPVPPGYSIAWVDLPLIGRRAGAVVFGWLGAAEDRLPAHALVIRPDGAGVPRGSFHPTPVLGRSLSRDARDPPGLASQTSRQKVRHDQTPHARPASDDPQHRPPGRSAGEREPAVGIPPDPRRTDEAGNCRRPGSPTRCGLWISAAGLVTVMRPVRTLGSARRGLCDVRNEKFR